MKTKMKSSRNRTLKSLCFLMTLIIASVSFTPANAQNKKANSTEISQNERTIKGIISDENGPLESASVVLKGTSIGTTTDSKGEFTFPKLLNTGDVLVISFLGFETVEAKIKENTSVLKLTLTSNVVEFVGALNTDKPYKSKRSKE